MFVPIDLVLYELLSVSVRASEGYERKESRPPAGAVDVALCVDEHTQDSTRWRLTLDVTVRPDTNGDAPSTPIPYDVEVKARAEFQFPADAKVENIQHTLRLNGASILYGLMRGTVSQFTAQSVNGQFLLPTFNFVALETKRQKDNEAAEQAATGAPQTTEAPGAAPASTGQAEKPEE